MRFRYRSIPFMACALLLVASTALAQKPAVQPTPIDLGDMNQVRIGTPLSGNTACVLGDHGTPTYVIDYFFPPNDTYYTLLRMDDCSACPGAGGVMLTMAHMILYHDTPCGLNVTVQVVEADLSNPGCPVPDPGKPLCDPVTYNLLPPQAGGIDYQMALPSACCITRDAFLSITVNSFIGDCANGTPLLVTSASCNPCQSWNFWSGGQDEVCSIGFPGNFSHYVEGDCCQTTPTSKGSWGRVKTMYR